MKLGKLSGVKIDWHYNQGGIDPPEIVYHVKSNPDVIIDRPPKPILQMITARGLPIRQGRWCCEYIKEWGGNDRVVILGVRAGESSKRKHYSIIQSYIKKDIQKVLFRPIIDWSTYEVWEFVREYDISYCSLYDEGAKQKGYGKGIFKRLGCVLCPMETNRQTQIELMRFPKICEAWRRAALRLYEERMSRGEGNSVEHWPTFDDMWEWWLSREKKKINELQGILL